jgi:cytochrome c553
MLSTIRNHTGIVSRWVTLTWCVGAAFCGAFDQAAPAVGAEPSSEQVAEFFESRVRPLLVGRCFACHSAETKPAGGLRVDDRNGLIHGGESGASLVPGQADASLLIERILSPDEKLRMPQEGERLTEAEVADLRRWIDDGAYWPKVDNATDPTVEDPKVVYEELRREHWAWQPLAQPPVPNSRDQSWAHGDVDRFLLAALEARGLRPVADADRATWLRRVTFDLTGLPPTEAQLDAFLADRSDRAFENVVDALLSSEAFGERWGRHWLDVARYGESTGPSRNIPYPHAWRYRDYVIDSVNADLPIDRFIREQVAGDLIAAAQPNLPDAERDRLLTATGYLALGVKDVNQRFKTRFDMDNVDEQIDAVSRGVLGLTVSCARCHDHKFDPIPTADYYALAGIFTSTLNAAGVRNKMGGSGLAYYDPQALIPLSQKAAPPAEAVVRAAEEKLREAQAAWDAIRGTPEGMALAKNGQRVQRRFKVALDEAQAAYDNLVGPAAGSALVHGLRDADTIADTAIRYRGEAEKLGPVVPRGFLSVVQVPDAPQVNPAQSGRLELAQWLTSPNNPLSPRVAVNQIWQHLFGEGLVPSADNFGTTGAAPSHPELLDFLAQRLIASGWSRKAMVRDLVLSRAYRLSSQASPEQLQIDPANRLVWRHNPRRLSAEELRDAVLSVTGSLELARSAGSPAQALKMVEMADNGGEAKRVHAQGDASRLRSIYLPLLRGVTPRTLETFDPAEQTLVTVKRDATTVPSQALFLLNSDFIQSYSDQFAKNLASQSMADDREAIRVAYRRVFSREPRASEIELAERFIQELEAAYQQAGPQAANAGLTPAAQSEAIDVVALDAAANAAANGGANAAGNGGANATVEPPVVAEADAGQAVAEPVAVTALSRSAKQAAWAAFHQSLLASAEFRYLR